MDARHTRYLTSDTLLAEAIRASSALHVETQTIHLAGLRFRPCEDYYSKGAHACTWPYSITPMDSSDQIEAVYEAIGRWADVILGSTPQLLLDHEEAPHTKARGGRKAHRLAVEEIGVDQGELAPAI